MPVNLTKYPIHLGLGATALIQPAFVGDMAWYENYSARNSKDGTEGRLVSSFRFDESWTNWEMHPYGSEVVVCTQGCITLIQHADDSLKSVTLNPGEYVINPPGVWHTADVDAPATALFITAGTGTLHRER